MSDINLKKAFVVNTGQRLGQCRAIPISMGKDRPHTILLIYSADFDIDPYCEMFFFPTDTLHMMLVSQEGEVLWTRDLGKGVIPGIWFCPVFAIDLDRDGIDEIYYVDNEVTDHPLSMEGYRLACIGALDGKSIGSWLWPKYCRDAKTMSHSFRNFIVGGYVNGNPVLVCIQGTYHDMHFQAYNTGMALRWTLDIPEDAPGARGSHMCPIVDFGDGRQKLMWGERCIELDDGQELFCADREIFKGHSDIIQPFLNETTGKWYFYVCRETYRELSPRVLVYDFEGRRVWGCIDEGHMDLGWIAHLPSGIVAATACIGKKFCGPDGRHHQGVDEFTFDALTGEPVLLPMGVYRMIPVDLNGDGFHEFVRGAPSGNGDVFNTEGILIGNVGGSIALACKFLNLPGEQLLSFDTQGNIFAYYDSYAKDSMRAFERYNNPFYKANTKIMANGYNWWCLSGI